MSCPAVGSQPTFTPTEKPQKPYNDPLRETIDKVAQTIRGVLVLNPNNVYLNTREVKIKQEETKTEKSDAAESTKVGKKVEPKKDALNAMYARWDKDREEAEAYSKKKWRIVVPTHIYSQESLNTCKEQHFAANEDGQRMEICENMGRQGTWSDVPPAGLENLPTNLPIELFMKKDGSFVTHGDKIQFEFEGKHVELTVCHTTKMIDKRTFETFEDHLKFCIEVSEACRFIMAGAVEWIQEQVRKGEPMPERSSYVWYDKVS
jgi:hypothetical protein